MNPTDPDVPSASKADSLKLAALTASLAASGRARKSDHPIPAALVQEIGQSFSALLSVAEANLSSSIAAEAARGHQRWQKAWAAWAMTFVAWLVLVAVLSTNQYRLLRFHALEQELAEIQTQIDEATAARQTADKQLEETQNTLRKLSQWAPISRFQLLPSQRSQTPCIRIVPGSVQNLEGGGTIALPELKREE